MFQQQGQNNLVLLLLTGNYLHQSGQQMNAPGIVSNFQFGIQHRNQI